VLIRKILRKILVLKILVITLIIILLILRPCTIVSHLLVRVVPLELRLTQLAFLVKELIIIIVRLIVGSI